MEQQQKKREGPVRCVCKPARSFKLVPFESLGAVFYSLSIVTMAVSLTVCEIFSVKV